MLEICRGNCTASLTAISLTLVSFKPEAAIINYYHLDSTLSGHTDHSELDLTAPLFSLRWVKVKNRIKFLYLIEKETKTEVTRFSTGEKYQPAFYYIFISLLYSALANQRSSFLAGKRGSKRHWQCTCAVEISWLWREIRGWLITLCREFWRRQSTQARQRYQRVYWEAKWIQKATVLRIMPSLNNTLRLHG